MLVQFPKKILETEHIKIYEKYFYFFLIYSASYILCSLQIDIGFGADKKFNIGLYAATAIQLILILYVIPNFTNTSGDNKYVWGEYCFEKRKAFFNALAIIHLFLHLQSPGFVNWFSNDYFQVWYITLLIICIF